jgi:DNA-binding response OmpR family regulator
MGGGVIANLPAALPGKPRLLLVDTDEGLRFAIGDYFRRVGALVDEAATPGEAEAWLAVTHYDAVITDLRLSSGERAEGLNLARRVRVIAPTTTVCILTVPEPPALMREAEAVASVVLTRPRKLPDLAQVVFAMLHDPAARDSTSTGTNS